MKKTTQFLMLAVAMIFSVAAFSQSTVTGTVLDNSNLSLPGVNILEKGTTNGVSSDFNGNFTIETKSSDAILVISYLGFLSQEISISGDTDLGDIILEASEFGLEEVQIIASVAVDRKTPVAVSTIKARDIEVKLGTQEFPEILKSTPGVYATKAGGGFGDGRINLRGFNSENVAVLINGVPVNDMENGRVYWSNWAGLSDVTSSMQVQRGLGASKVAVPSVGGTINIVTKTTDVEAGGNVYTTLANDGYKKFGFTLSTGMLKGDWATTVSAAKTDGDGYVDGTEFNAISYFINISKLINDNHKVSFTAFGAKQRHGQRQNSQSIATYQASESGRKFNADWGYKNGQVTHQEDNFYHKPQISLNHYWTINDKTSLSTAAYASFGSGGGGGVAGEYKFGLGDNGLSEYRIGRYGPVDFDKIVAENVANGANGSETILRASRNDHKWYGVLSTLKLELTDNLDLLGGLDWRAYKGIHFSEVTDLLGGQYFLDDSNINNPDALLQVGDKRDYYNDGLVSWLGGFAQLEYSKDALAAFISLAASNTGYKRIDYFNYLDSDSLQETDRYNFFGYSVKGGANYNLTENHNVFANIGYFEKAPGFDAVFLNFDNEHINADAENQKIFSFEIGYGYRSEKLNANINLYSTSWKDRTFTDSFTVEDDDTGEVAQYFANLTGVNALHQGIEIDLNYKVAEPLTLTAMASFGNWRWTDNIENVQITDEQQNVIEEYNLFIKGLKVSDAAQTTMALGANLRLLPETNLFVDYNYYTNIFADYDPNDRSVDAIPDGDAEQAWKMPDYGLFDVALVHGFDFGSFNAQVIGRINNLFDTEYISDAFDSDGTAQGARVYYGFGRTFSVGAKLNF